MAVVAVVALAVTACGGSSSDQDAEISATTLAETTTTTFPGTTTTSAETTTTEVVTTTTASETTTTGGPERVEIVISFTGGAVEGGGRLPVPLGEDVVITVTADVSDEIHLHGYDVYADVAPETPGTLEFTADIPGVFELELESVGERLAELEISP